VEPIDGFPAKFNYAPDYREIKKSKNFPAKLLTTYSSHMVALLGSINIKALNVLSQFMNMKIRIDERSSRKVNGTLLLGNKLRTWPNNL